MSKKKGKGGVKKEDKGAWKQARTFANRAKRVKRHMKRHPNDKVAPDILEHVLLHGHGPALNIPTPALKNKHEGKPTGLQDLDVEFRAHHTITVRKNGKANKVVVLEESAATKPIYEVIADAGTTQDRSIVLKEVEDFFSRSHGACSIVERKGDAIKVVRSKKATPPKGFDNQFKSAYAG